MPPNESADRGLCASMSPLSTASRRREEKSTEEVGELSESELGCGNGFLNLNMKRWKHGATKSITGIGVKRMVLPRER